MARIKDASVEAVKAATDIVALVEGYTRLRKSGARFTGLCPFHQEKTPSFGVSPDRGTLQVLRLRRGRRRDHLRREDARTSTSSARSSGWPTGSACRSSTRRRSPEQDRQRAAARAAVRAARAGDELLRALPVGVATRGEARARVPRRAAGSARRSAASSGSGSRPAARRSPAKAREKGFTREELAAAGLANRRGNDYFNGRLLFPLADARGRVRGFQARQAARGRPAARQVRQLARGRALPQGRPALRARPGADARSPSRTARSSSRGTPT